MWIISLHWIALKSNTANFNELNFIIVLALKKIYKCIEILSSHLYIHVKSASIFFCSSSSLPSSSFVIFSYLYLLHLPHLPPFPCYHISSQLPSSLHCFLKPQDFSLYRSPNGTLQHCREGATSPLHGPLGKLLSWS